MTVHRQRQGLVLPVLRKCLNKVLNFKTIYRHEIINAHIMTYDINSDAMHIH